MKKKMISLILTAALLTITAGCGNTGTQSGGQTDGTQPAAESTTQSAAAAQAEADTQDSVAQPDAQADEATQAQAEAQSEAAAGDTSGATEGEESGSNVLVAYFSWADNAVLDEDVDAVSSPSVTAPGNVQELAGWVQEETGGDLFSIRVTDPYPGDWDECLDRANEERGEDARPQLQENVENLDNYDTVFLGYPN